MSFFLKNAIFRFIPVLLALLLLCSCTEVKEKVYLGSSIQHADYYNFYASSPDIPSQGTLKFTPLASYLVNCADENEELYFIVGVNHEKTAEINKPPFYDYIYGGKTLNEYQADLTEAPIGTLNKLMETGLSAEEAVASDEYRQIAEKYYAAQKAYQTACAAYACEGHAEDEIPESAKYLDNFGIELCCKPYSLEWQYHLNMIKLSSRKIDAINGTMSYLVKCTRAELLELSVNNTEYAYVFYASEKDGRFIQSNKPDTYSKFFWTDEFFFYDRTLTSEHMAYSYEELGLYDSLTYNE